MDAAGERNDAREAQLQGYAEADVLEFCDGHRRRIGAFNDDMDRFVFDHYGSDDMVQRDDHRRVALAWIYGDVDRDRRDLDEKILEALAFQFDLRPRFHYGNGRDTRRLALI